MSASTTTVASAGERTSTRSTVSSLGVTPWRRAAAVLLATEVVVLYAPTMNWLFDRWTLSVWHHAHGLLIPPLVGYFAYRELKPLAGLPQSASAWGFAFLLPALLLLGAQRTRAIAFPLVFLAFSLPIPLAFTEQIHWQLRQLTTAAAAEAIPWFGIPVFAEGTTLHMAGGALQIADACSGFSTLYAAAAVACLVAYSASSPRRRLLVLLSAAPLAIGANLLRVLGLVLLVVWKGPAILDTFLHPLSGMLTFALALPVIFWLGADSKGAGRS